MDGVPKTAACACGALTVTVSAAPKFVHACACRDCQRRSGSVYTYTAFFAEGDVAVAGDYRSWRRRSDAGRFHESNFCPTCGSAVFSRLESLPGIVGVPVGNFADPSFAKPAKLYWTVHQHEWLKAPDGSLAVERQ